MTNANQGKSASNPHGHGRVTRPTPDRLHLCVTDATQIEALFGEFHLVQSFDDGDLGAAELVFFLWSVQETLEGFEQAGNQVRQTRLAGNLRGLRDHEVRRVAQV